MLRPVLLLLLVLAVAAAGAGASLSLSSSSPPATWAAPEVFTAVASYAPWRAGRDVPLLNRTCASGRCRLTQLLVSEVMDHEARPAAGWTAARVRVVADDTVVAEWPLGPGAAVGFNDSAAAWGTAGTVFGMTARGGGTSWLLPVPFARRCTVEFVPPPSGSGVFWMDVHGADGAALPPVTVAGVPLPDAARLRVYVTADVEVAPLANVTWAAVPRGRSGAVVLTTFAARSTRTRSLAFLEGFVTADAETVLGSGTEDFFLSAAYFSAGPFTGATAGCTQRGDADVAAYRVLIDRDPVWFERGLTLSSSNGNPLLNMHFEPARFTTTTWTYEWDA